jgi:branched-chain amino acid transport system ATP-binding protein
MSTGDPLLVVSDLHAGYGSLQAVDGISLQVGEGETVALIGRNGAGKTTSLLAIAGLRYGRFPGSVKLVGTDVSRASSRQIVDAGLAHVPEGHRIFSSLSVEENLRLGAYTRRRSGRKAVATTMERVFDLFPILRTYASRNAGFLSGGEQQMVAIGQALMAEPRVLMLDEPTSGLAPIVIRTIYDAIGQLRHGARPRRHQRRLPDPGSGRARLRHRARYRGGLQPGQDRLKYCGRGFRVNSA